MSIQPYRRGNNLEKILQFEREMKLREKQERIKRDCKSSEGGVELPINYGTQEKSDFEELGKRIKSMWADHPELWKIRPKKYKHERTIGFN